MLGSCDINACDFMQGFVMVGRVLYTVERRDVLGSVTDYIIKYGMPIAAGLGH